MDTVKKGDEIIPPFFRGVMIVFNKNILARFENQFLYLFNSDNGAILKLSAEAVSEYYTYQVEYLEKGEVTKINDIALFQALRREQFLLASGKEERSENKEDFVSNRTGLQSDFAPFG